MILDINKIIVMKNKEKYLVVDKVVVEEEQYYYIVEVTEKEDNIKDNYKIVKAIPELDGICLEEVIGEEKLKKVLPFFITNISN